MPRDLEVKAFIVALAALARQHGGSVTISVDEYEKARSDELQVMFTEFGAMVIQVVDK